MLSVVVLSDHHIAYSDLPAGEDLLGATFSAGTPVALVLTLHPLSYIDKKLEIFQNFINFSLVTSSVDKILKIFPPEIVTHVVGRKSCCKVARAGSRTSGTRKQNVAALKMELKIHILHLFNILN